MAQSLYVYAVVAAPAPDALGTGIDGLPLTAVEAGGLAAIVHEHAGPAYAGGEEEVRRRALEHNAVVDRLWRAEHAIVPMAFDVIVAASESRPAAERLAAWLGDAAEGVAARLAAVRGRVELRADLGLDRAAAASRDEEVGRLRQEAGIASPGVARLLQKRIQRREHEVAERRADALYPGLRRRLAAASTELVENGRATAEPGEALVLSASLLVDEDAVVVVGTELRRMSEEEPALRIRFYGPWPPYSFADLGGAAPGGTPPDSG